MATATNRTTKEYRQGITSPINFPVSHWILDSAQAAALFAANVPSRYWNIVGDTITEMTPAEKVAADAAIANATRDSIIAQLDDTENLIRAFAQVVMDEINTLRALHGLPPRTLAQLRAAIRAKLGS